MRIILFSEGFARVVVVAVVVLLSNCLVSFGQVTHEVIVEANQAPALVSNAGGDILSSSNEEAVLGESPAATGGTGPYTYLWEPETNLSNPLIANPTLSLINAAPSYTLHVLDANGCRSSDEVSIQVVITAIENSQFQLYKIYPNPASDYLVVEALVNNARFMLFDQTGKLVYDEKLMRGENKVLVQMLGKGVYLAKVRSRNKEVQWFKIAIK